jgi:hypothetical protein
MNINFSKNEDSEKNICCGKSGKDDKEAWLTDK